MHEASGSSIDLIKQLMMGDFPMLPNVYIAVCDVRDAARAHVVAMTLDEAVNNRHLIANVTDTRPMRDWALILQNEFKPKNYSFSTCVAPNL